MWTGRALLSWLLSWPLALALQRVMRPLRARRHLKLPSTHNTLLATALPLRLLLRRTALVQQAALAQAAASVAAALPQRQAVEGSLCPSVRCWAALSSSSMATATTRLSAPALLSVPELLPLLAAVAPTLLDALVRPWLAAGD